MTRTLTTTALLAALLGASALARPVEVSVVVLDPNDIPIPHALVLVAASGPPWELPTVETNARGVATLTIEAPDIPVARLRAFILDGPGPGAPGHRSIYELVDRMAVRQFEALGYSTTILQTENAASIVAKADPAALRTGQLSGPGAASITVVNHLTSSLPQRDVTTETGAYSLHVPLGRRFNLYLQSDEFMLVHPVGPLAPTDALPRIEIDQVPPFGRLTGSVVGMEDRAAPYLGLTAVRVDGGAIFPLTIRPNGRFDDNQNGTIDPSDENQNLILLPGDYYIVADTLPLLRSSHTIIHAIRTDTAQRERDALVRMTIESDKRTVVEWDAATLTSTTDALVRAVLFTP